MYLNIKSLLNNQHNINNKNIAIILFEILKPANQSFDNNNLK
jgi:hypothetical protein